MHINFHHKCLLRENGTLLLLADCGIKDLGVKVSSNFHWHTRCSEASAKAFRVVNCILRALQHSTIA